MTINLPRLERFSFLALAFLSCGVAELCGAEPIGQRPYELVWANRTNDTQLPLVDFEDLTGWRVECKGAEAKFERTREQQLWGQHVGKLTYRGTGPSPELRVLPPGSVAIPRPFDAMTLWCYGNNWGWTTDPSTPRVGLAALFEDAAGSEFSVPLATVNWKEWFLLHQRLTPEQIERVKTGAKFMGLLINGGRNKDDRVLYFDNLAVFTEEFPPLQFEPRPERGIAMFSGQSQGANTGPGQLPFPTRVETILPDNLSRDFRNTLTEENGVFVFTYAGGDSLVQYRYEARTGTWGDLEVRWGSSAGPLISPSSRGGAVAFRPCVGGGVYLHTSKGPMAPDSAESLGTQRQGDAVESRWRLHAGEVTADVTYVFRLWNKSLVMDVLASGGLVAEVRYGRAVGLADPRLVTNPFYPAEGGRPAVMVSGTEDHPLFLTGNTDWYRSNGSILWAANSIAANGVVYNGGTRYIPLTNGKRNDCFERFFITVSPRYEEMLPNIPNPPSPWRHITGTRLWRAHGASNREQDRQHWANVHRHGMTQMVVTDHEGMWRDEGESFTFRTKAAPGKGGDPGAYDYARFMQDQLGFVYGPYNNYTDFAPVNEFWSTDMVSRDPQNQMQHAWMRCYAPKPARAIEYCAKLAPQIQDKFKFSTAYCDVHTAVAPWHRVDYDPRVPGAGTFAAVFYSYGEIMLQQKRAWNGPVYSEGNYHSFYMGLTDGNYGQDQSYRPAENPWLVDFDLRKMHDLGCNFGMGSLDMFYANVPQPRATKEERDAEIDRFLAATVAFGHPGFLVMEGGMGSAARSYFMLQQLHSRYCLTNASDIRYADAGGALLDTSRAVASGAYRRSQVVTRYADGTITAANGSKSDRLKVRAFGRDLDLPPNGYAGWTADGAIEVLSGDRDGHRCDYAVTPAYLYADGRGQFTCFDKVACDGPLIALKRADGTFEIIPVGQCATFGVNLDGRDAKAVALDKERKELGPASTRLSRGLVYVTPVTNAFSYLLSPSAAPAAALKSNRTQIVAGETVTITGQHPHRFTAPSDAKPGARLWQQLEDGWIDFTVVPLVEARLSVRDGLLVPAATNAGTALVLELTPHVPESLAAQVTLAGHTQTATLTPGHLARLEFPFTQPERETTNTLSLIVLAGELRHADSWQLRAGRSRAAVAPMPEKFRAGQCLRNKAETVLDDASGAHVTPRAITCGGVTRHGLSLSPPYQGGTGYSFVLYEPVTLPHAPQAVFRCDLGKEDGSDRGDGILFRVLVVDSTGKETLIAEKQWAEHDWTALEADLSRWAGRTIQIKLVADVGPADNSYGDWAAWSHLRLESKEPVLQMSVQKQ